MKICKKCGTSEKMSDTRCAKCRKDYIRQRRIEKAVLIGTKESWRQMVSRCCNTANKDWKRYGGRGIKICDRWLVFQNFLDDMGERPIGHSIDRRDNERGYEPDNCRWATVVEQANNRRSNVWITHGGVTDTLTGWAERVGVRVDTLWRRLNVWHMPLTKALIPGKLSRWCSYE